MQHPLPASFHQQEGGALMFLIQSKKMKSLFSNLILGLLQGADSQLLLYSLLHFLLYHILVDLVKRTREWVPTVIGVLLRVTEQHRANFQQCLQANLLARIMGENPIGETDKLGEQHMLALVQMSEESAVQVKRFLDVTLLQHPGTHAVGQLMISRLL